MFPFQTAADDAPELKLADDLVGFLNARPVDPATVLNVLFSLYRHMVLQRPEQHGAALRALSSFADELVSALAVPAGGASAAAFTANTTTPATH